MGISDIILQWQQEPAASLPTAFIATGVLLLLVPKLRQFVLDALETVIATFLLLVLIGAVLGLPFGKHPCSNPGSSCQSEVCSSAHGSATRL